MAKFVLTILCVLCSISVQAQGLVKGTVFDKQTVEPLGFVTVQVMHQGKKELVDGGMTDIEGKFSIDGLKVGKYDLVLTYIGYKEERRDFEITAEKLEKSFNVIYMSEDAKQLKEVKVMGQKSAMKLEVDRKSFDVSQLINSAGQAASDILEDIPSVEVDNDGNVSLRGNSSVEVWINGKASGLTADNRASILQQLPAESIERIEVIDNPSAKFSAEGSAGIINIVLKKDRAAGYYGSVQGGGNTNGAANASANINYNSSLLDAYANVGYRHHVHDGHSESWQDNFKDGQKTSYNNYNTDDKNWGNNLFTRAGLTFHVTKKDDISLSGMLMKGGRESRNTTPYHYGSYNPDGTTFDEYIMNRRTTGSSDMQMLHGEFGYTHTFTDTHKLDFNFSANKWASDNSSFYRDYTDYGQLTPSRPDAYSWQFRPQDMGNHSFEAKLDYENQISENFKIESGYNWRGSYEDTPQRSYEATSADGVMPDIFESTDPDLDYSDYEEHKFFNRFIYDMNVHALYLTTNFKFGNFGLMAGLRGEYWKVHTESYDWDQEYAGKPKDKPFDKDYFQLFPSLFASYQLTENDQLQLNYTRRLRRPWGGQLNSFRDTRDATMISFGNPELTPEFSNSFSFNYLRTWAEHSALLSLYYRPTTDVMQRISYRDLTEDIMYSTSMNVAKSTSSGAELTIKNKLFRILDLTTNVNAYYYKLDAFSYEINNQLVTGAEREQFTWNARMQASLILPYDISVQLSGRYRSRQAITQGYRPAMYSMDFGIRKNFYNKLFTLAVNCRDLLDSRQWKSVTESDTFWRKQLNRGNSRNVSVTLTWNFGNMKAKKPNRDSMEGMPEGGMDYNSAGMEE